MMAQFLCKLDIQNCIRTQHIHLQLTILIRYLVKQGIAD